MSSRSHPEISNYTDDVPFVINSRWKVPPLPQISEDLVQPFFCPSSLSYDFGLERTVLNKTAEWQLTKAREVAAREERLKLRREDRLRQFEEEQKRKLNQVSYPNPDEISSDDETEPPPPPRALPALTPYNNNFDTILMPTVVARAAVATATGGAGTKKINYSDFENDTTDPFHSAELKTINDLDILAQVLKTTTQHHSKDVQNDDDNDEEGKATPKADKEATNKAT